MHQIFMDFNEDLCLAQEYLVIVCSPNSLSLKQRWRNNGLSADFMADYFANFFTTEDDVIIANKKKKEVKSAISFIANELLENSMKFSDQNSPYSISMKLQMHNQKIVFVATNSIDIKGITKLKAFIEDLTNNDPSELYIAQLEKNAEDEHSIGSGLGFLTMINDYLAQIGWKFETVQQEPEVTTVTTMVQLPL